VNRSYIYNKYVHVTPYTATKLASGGVSLRYHVAISLPWTVEAVEGCTGSQSQTRDCIHFYNSLSRRLA